MSICRYIFWWNGLIIVLCVEVNMAIKDWDDDKPYNVYKLIENYQKTGTVGVVLRAKKKLKPPKSVGENNADQSKGKSKKAKKKISRASKKKKNEENRLVDGDQGTIFNGNAAGDIPFDGTKIKESASDKVDSDGSVFDGSVFEDSGFDDSVFDDSVFEDRGSEEDIFGDGDSEDNPFDEAPSSEELVDDQSQEKKNKKRDKKEDVEIDNPEIYDQFKIDTGVNQFQGVKVDDFDKESLYKKKLKQEGISASPVLRKMIKNVFSFIFVILIAFIVVNFVAQVTSVFGNSMAPTLQGKMDGVEIPGDMLLLEKVTHRLVGVTKGDIVVLDASRLLMEATGEIPDGFIIKRVIGIAGDEIIIRDGVLVRNGYRVEEPYTSTAVTGDEGGQYAKMVVPQDHIYVLGDNRNVGESLDSRVIGPIHVDNIKGRAILRIYPFDRFGVF
jgi:signal peptidase I